MLSCYILQPATHVHSFRMYGIKYICRCIIKFHAKYKTKYKWIFITSRLCSRFCVFYTEILI
jgi:hypothetical protein